MITLEHIRNLSATELRVVAYLSLMGKSMEKTQHELAKELNLSDKSIGNALRTLEKRGIILYNREVLSKEKGKIVLH